MTQPLTCGPAIDRLRSLPNEINALVGECKRETTERMLRGEDPRPLIEELTRLQEQLVLARAGAQAAAEEHRREEAAMERRLKA